MLSLIFLVANTLTFIYFLDQVPEDLEFFWYFFDFLVGVYIWSNHHRFSINEKKFRKNNTHTL